MKHRKIWMALLLCAALLLSGCAGTPQSRESGATVLRQMTEMMDSVMNAQIAVKKEMEVGFGGIGEE